MHSSIQFYSNTKQVFLSRTTASYDVQTWFSVLMAFANFLSKLKEIFNTVPCIMDTALSHKYPFILDRNLAKETAQKIRFARPVMQ